MENDLVRAGNGLRRSIPGPRDRISPVSTSGPARADGGQSGHGIQAAKQRDVIAERILADPPGKLVDVRRNGKLGIECRRAFATAVIGTPQHVPPPAG
ncbi:hypothetical protein GCM10017567_58700 [Amycolatopsis bullii]|uniref:Transposase n=1 Tax=Amycolatopsis bullii TaxID=941987 RepID=A0ABQ3KMF9_9PSEU|nr:hypothetical protein GCM10017567_58700 [Amycolatopsis bullii]